MNPSKEGRSLAIPRGSKYLKGKVAPISFSKALQALGTVCEMCAEKFCRTTPLLPQPSSTPHVHTNLLTHVKQALSLYSGNHRLDSRLAELLLSYASSCWLRSPPALPHKDWAAQCHPTWNAVPHVQRHGARQGRLGPPARVRVT